MTAVILLNNIILVALGFWAGRCFGWSKGYSEGCAANRSEFVEAVEKLKKHPWREK